MVTVEVVRDALKDVQDPELLMGILDLGLVYDVACEGSEGEDVTVVMTLTSPMCPVGPMFKQAVLSKVESVPGSSTRRSTYVQPAVGPQDHGQRRCQASPRHLVALGTTGGEPSA